MDGERFDYLTRKLAAGASRRGVLKGILGGVAGGLAGLAGRESAAQDCTLYGHPCTDGDTCCNGAVCSGGACRCPAGVSVCNTSDGPACVSCPPDQVLAAGCQCRCRNGGEVCDGACVQTRTDRANCGGCGNVCDTDEFCANGVCRGCPPGTILCNSRCVAACRAGQELDVACRCTCPSGTVLCPGGCADTQTNLDNCGDCGIACEAPANATASCTNGQCGFACNPGYQLCEDACIPVGDCCTAANCQRTTCQRAVCTDGDCGLEPDPAAVGNTCADGPDCTVNTVCQSDGTCNGDPCSSLDDLCFEYACNETSGVCVSNPLVNCGESGPCVTRFCVSDTGTCGEELAPDFLLCDTGDPCKETGICFDGECEADDINCSDLDDQCSAGVCNPDNGQCVKEARNPGASCDDDNPCTTASQCISGLCEAISFVECPPAGECQTGDGVCNPETGFCESENKSLYAACGNEQFCCSGECCEVDLNSCDSAGRCSGSFIPPGEPCNPVLGEIVCESASCDQQTGLCE